MERAKQKTKKKISEACTSCTYKGLIEKEVEGEREMNWDTFCMNNPFFSIIIFDFIQIVGFEDIVGKIHSLGHLVNLRRSLPDGIWQSNPGTIKQKK